MASMKVATSVFLSVFLGVAPSSAVAWDTTAQLVGVHDVDPAALVEVICESPRQSVVRFVDLDLDGSDDAIATALCGDEVVPINGVFVEGPEFPALAGSFDGDNVRIEVSPPSLTAAEAIRADAPTLIRSTYALIGGRLEVVDERRIGFEEYITSALASPIDRDLDYVLNPGILRVIRVNQILVPSAYDPATPAPLLISLHGHPSWGLAHETVSFKFAALADQLGWIYTFPDGSYGPEGRFWNATDACCDFYDLGVDDVAYIEHLIDEISGMYNVDAERVYVVGHSNGGFMAHRLACDLSDRITAAVSIAGAQWFDPDNCHPTDRVGVLEIHGNDDECVHYTGGVLPCDGPPHEPPYPSARQTVEEWADLNECQAKLITRGQRLDLDSSLDGKETRVERFRRCRGGPVELWTIDGGKHALWQHGMDWPQAIFDFLMAVKP
jgi:polyhydroxybutyrate depolymerase